MLKQSKYLCKRGRSQISAERRNIRIHKQKWTDRHFHHSLRDLVRSKLAHNQIWCKADCPLSTSTLQRRRAQDLGRDSLY